MGAVEVEPEPGRLEEAEQGRIVVVSSDAYKLCRGIRFEDLRWSSGFKTFRTYGRSKLANILFATLTGPVTVN